MSMDTDLLIKDLYHQVGRDVCVQLNSPYMQSITYFQKISLKEIQDEIDGYLLQDSNKNKLALFLNDLQSVEYSTTNSNKTKPLDTCIKLQFPDNHVIHFYIKLP